MCVLATVHLCLRPVRAVSNVARELIRSGKEPYLLDTRNLLCTRTFPFSCALNYYAARAIYLLACAVRASAPAAAFLVTSAAEILMRFQHLAHQLTHSMNRLFRKRLQEYAFARPVEIRQRGSGIGSAHSGNNQAVSPTSGDFAPDRRQRIETWRRRVLLKKGARLHSASLGRGDHCSLAVLDSRGVVVAWYDDSSDSSRVGTHIVDRHVSQFYVATDLASNLPGLNLLSAALYGGNTQQGWRRQPSGAIIWGTTVIEAIVLKDGRLQGFTHVVRPADGPRQNIEMQMRQPSAQKAANAIWGR